MARQPNRDTNLNEGESTKIGGKLDALGRRYAPLARQVALAGNKNERKNIILDAPHAFMKVGRVLKRLWVSDGKHDDEPLAGADEAVAHGGHLAR